MTSRHVVIFAVEMSLLGCPADGASDPGTPDAASNMVDAGPFDCFGLINCDYTCSAPQCFEACSANSTETAQTLDTTFEDCIATACPATDGGPCALSISGACQDCTQGVQTAGQPCAAAIGACVDDMSGSAGNQTGSGCNSLTSCLDGCGSVNCESGCLMASSSLGYQLYEIFVECVNRSCPATDGGPCVSATSQTCSSCEGTAQSTGGACATDYDNCENSP